MEPNLVHLIPAILEIPTNFQVGKFGLYFGDRTAILGSLELTSAKLGQKISSYYHCDLLPKLKYEEEKIATGYFAHSCTVNVGDPKHMRKIPSLP